MEQQKVKPADGKLGIMVVGCGAVSTTFITGVLMTRKGLAKPVGSMTQYDKIRIGRGADKKYMSYGDIVPLTKYQSRTRRTREDCASEGRFRQELRQAS